MLLKKDEKTVRVMAVVAVLLVIAVCGTYLTQKLKKEPQKTEEAKSAPPPAVSEDAGRTDITVKKDGSIQGKIVRKPDIDYKNLQKNDELRDMMGTRKKQLGLEKSLDMIVNSDESFVVGDVRISMGEILKQAFVKEGDVYGEKIEQSGEVKPRKIKQYGIYVVQPGDNIWNIHFNILREFYDHQGIQVSPKADEPVSSGMSSGVGKILKFSETMVIIYNMVEKTIDKDIDLLQPLSKIVVYNMDEVFALLKEINYDNIDRIQFDGKTIWVPTEKS